MQVAANTIGLLTSVTIGAYLKWIPKKRPLKSMKPDSELPEIIQNLLNETFLSNGVPWSTVVNVVRSRLVCKAGANCIPGSVAYAVDLPKVYRSGLSTWHLSTQAMLRTGYPTSYPVATVINVPSDTPENVYKIVDTQIVPMIQANGNVLNMGPNWKTSTTGAGLDITGNSAHSFVIKNSANHEVYFAKVPETEIDEQTEYWTIIPNAQILFWQDVQYWPRVSGRTWKAFSLPKMSDDQAAYIAEAMMYDYLGNERPAI